MGGPRSFLTGGFFLLGALYLTAHLLTLSRFPFVHSDEAWLASLTRTMWIARDVAATEDFFVLTPRHPHALKTLFHLIQMPFVVPLYSATTARLPSLVAYFFAVFFAWRAAKTLFRSQVVALFLAIFLLLDVQLIYIGHLARAEAILVAVQAWAISHYCGTVVAGGRDYAPGTWRTALPLGLVLGAAIGVHPNASVIAAPFVVLYLVAPRVAWRTRLVVPVVLIVMAIGFLAASVAMSADFLAYYQDFGDSVGVTDHPIRRLVNLRDFFIKMYHRYAGTYYLPPVQGQLVTFGAAVVIGLGLLRRPAVRAVMILLVATIAGQFVVGKFGPPTVVFFWIPSYLLCGTVVDVVIERWKPGNVVRRMIAAVGVLLVVLSGAGTAREIAQHRSESYRDYLAAISHYVPRDARVLANVNTAFYFAPGRLRVWRDLVNLPRDARGRGAIAAFLEDERIEYILYPDELDLIYTERPVWNIVYGNLYPYYDELQQLLLTRCELVATISSPRYAMRIVPRVDGTHRLKVYRVRR